MSIKFEKGQNYNVVKTLGVVKKADGRLQISQRVGKDASDIQVTEMLKFDGRDAGKLWFVREDGTRVCGHRTHFDPADAYNTAEKAAPKQKVDKLVVTKEKVSAKQAELEATTRLLETLLEEEAAAMVASTPTEVEPVVTADPVIEEARDEAAALFES